MSSSLKRLLSTLFLLLMFPLATLADPLPEPTGTVLLIISGKIKHTNGDGIARFDRDMLESLGMVKLSTKTYWTDGVQQFEGIPAKALMERVGVSEGTLRVYGLDNYSAKVPVEDMFKHRVLMAMKNNGQYMRVRYKGPLWLIYPLDDQQQLLKKQINSRSVWQISKIEVL